MTGYQCDECEKFTRRALMVMVRSRMGSEELHFCSWECLCIRAAESVGIPLDDDWHLPVEELLNIVSEPVEEDGEIVVPALQPHRYVPGDEDGSTCAECGEGSGYFLHRADLRSLARADS